MAQRPNPIQEVEPKNRNTANYRTALTIGLLFIILLIGVNWFLVRKISDGNPMRLRWHVVAAEEIPQGAKIAPESVSMHFGSLPHDALFISTLNKVEGKYAVDTIAANTPIFLQDITASVSITLDPATVIVPVEVQAEHGKNLVRGMRVAFVQDNIVVPPASNPTGGLTLANGLLLLNIVEGSPNASTITVEISVPISESEWIGALATGTWRPVIVIR